MPAAPPEEITPTPEIGDTYLGANVLLPRGGTLVRGRVAKRKRDQHGEVTGRAHIVPTFDTREYEIEWDNGGLSATTANVIAELTTQATKTTIQNKVMMGTYKTRKTMTVTTMTMMERIHHKYK